MSEPRDAELEALLLVELSRHRPCLLPDATFVERRRALHALKGSAGLAGARALSEALARLERRGAASDLELLALARACVDEAIEALSAGNPVPELAWPTPPIDLVATAPGGPAADTYPSAMQDRLAQIDDALARDGAPREIARELYRNVHAMKGAALAVGDEVMAWFCHGLESMLGRAVTPFSSVRPPARETSRPSADPPRDVDPAALAAIQTVAEWRALLGELVASPAAALERLRIGSPGAVRHATTLPLPPRRPAESLAESEPPSRLGEAMLRVPSATLDRLLERVRQVSRARGTLLAGANGAHLAATRSLELREGLLEALRLIGPPRPWGAPAAAIRRIEQSLVALDELARQLEQRSSSLTVTAERVTAEISAAEDELASMRATEIGTMFDRVTGGVSALTRREGVAFRFELAGTELLIERRLADALYDPIMQLVRNAAVHGIESADERAARGKPVEGVIRLVAEVRGGGLAIRVHDDGAGVDLAAVRKRAAATGLLDPETAATVDDQALLGLLFLPGFSMRDRTDVLAGRGVGLDLTHASIRRLGGTVRLDTRSGVGLYAEVQVPIEGRTLRVVWLRSGGEWCAMPVQQARRAMPGAPGGGARPLYDLLPHVLGDPRAPTPASAPPTAGLLLEVGDPDSDRHVPSLLVHVDEIGAVEEVTLRAVSPLVMAAGPFVGAIVRGDDLSLCIDARGLAEHASFLTGPARAGAGGSGRREPGEGVA